MIRCTQICSPACTELEVIMMDWLGKFLDLPPQFLNCSEGPGGGVIQGSASESILVAVLAAREQAVKRIRLEQPQLSESDIRGKLIAYSSDQSNSAVEKSGLLAAVPFRLLPSDENFALNGAILQAAYDEDIARGKIPIICVATLGTTGTCAYDDLDQLGPICQANHVWLHIDAAYAGAALCCPEFRPLMRGIEWSDSFNYNLHKWMMVNFDCCAMWFKNADQIVDSFTVDRIYLDHQYQGESRAPDYRHWQIPLGRRFRALKVWIVLRTVGAEKIREHIRNTVRLAAQFEQLVVDDDRFEIVAPRSMGLVCFRLKGDCTLSKELLERITARKQIYMIHSKCHGQLIIRYVVCGLDPKEADVEFAWREIQEQATLTLAANKAPQVVPASAGIIDKMATTFSKDLDIQSEANKQSII